MSLDPEGAGPVLTEAQAGWDHLKLPGSPTFVLPSGSRHHAPGLPKLTLDETRNARITPYQPAPCSGPDPDHDHNCLTPLRQLLTAAANHPRPS